MPILLSPEYHLKSAVRELERQVKEIEDYIKNEEEYIEIYIGLGYQDWVDKALRTRSKLKAESEDRQKKLKKAKTSLEEIRKARERQKRIGIYINSQFDRYKSQLLDIAEETGAKATISTYGPFVKIESETLRIELIKHDYLYLNAESDLDILFIDSKLKKEVQKGILANTKAKTVIKFRTPGFCRLLANSILKIPLGDLIEGQV